MKKLALFIGVSLLVGCASHKPEAATTPTLFEDRHMKNVTRLTSDGDNGEAYFSADGKKLIWQSSRGGYACDKIWTMQSDGSEKKMVSPDHGAHTCSYFFPDGKRIVFASTSHLPGACPPKPQ